MRARAIFLSPAGAVLALISFFLPWAKVSCAPVVNRTVSGASLGGMFWLVIPFGAAILLSFFYFMSRLAVARSRPFIVAISAAALAVMIAKCSMLAQDAVSGISGKAAAAFDFRLQFGGVATFVGLLISLAGGLAGCPCKPAGPPPGDPSCGTPSSEKEGISDASGASK